MLHFILSGIAVILAVVPWLWTRYYGKDKKEEDMQSQSTEPLAKKSQPHQDSTDDMSAESSSDDSVASVNFDVVKSLVSVGEESIAIDALASAMDQRLKKMERKLENSSVEEKLQRIESQLAALLERR